MSAHFTFNVYTTSWRRPYRRKVTLRSTISLTISRQDITCERNEEAMYLKRRFLLSLGIHHSHSALTALP